MIPINVDRNVSPAYFRESGVDGRLHVTSIFYTVQGEGPLAGLPAVFLRLAGCNIGAKLDCPWCDTRFHIDDAMIMPQDEVAERIKDVSRGRTALIVVTGGEPLLQWGAMQKLIDKMPGHVWQFETNGHYLRDWVVDDIAALSGSGTVHFVVSPKIPHGKTGHSPLKLPATVNGLVSLKYVIDADPASPYHEIGPYPLDGSMMVYVSAVTVYKRPCRPGEIANFWDDTLIDRQATGSNYRRAAQIVAALGAPLRLSYQTHLLGALE